jgi:hypothetical protein
MYSPTSSTQLLADATKLLLHLEQYVDVNEGYDVLLAFYYLCSTHNVDIHEPIIGEKYSKFIYKIYEAFDDVKNFNPLDIKLPYTRYNIRNGMYTSIIGMMSEFISLASTKELYESANITQDKNLQTYGSDIIYYDCNNFITADVKTSKTDWTHEKTMYAHRDWFKPGKSSSRLHIVDICNAQHHIISRPWLYQKFKEYGNYIPIEKIQNESLKSQNISHIINSFYTEGK